MKYELTPEERHDFTETMLEIAHEAGCLRGLSGRELARSIIRRATNKGRRDGFELAKEKVQSVLGKL